MRELICQMLKEHNSNMALIKAIDNNQDLCKDEQFIQHHMHLKRRASMVESWITLLTPSEAFVVRRHLVDRLDWPRIEAEYRTLWGEEFARGERSLQRYQSDAITKIERFVSVNWGVFQSLMIPQGEVRLPFREKSTHSTSS